MIYGNPYTRYLVNNFLFKLPTGEAEEQTKYKVNNFLYQLPSMNNSSAILDYEATKRSRRRGRISFHQVLDASFGDDIHYFALIRLAWAFFQNVEKANFAPTTILAPSYKLPSAIVKRVEGDLMCCSQQHKLSHWQRQARVRQFRLRSVISIAMRDKLAITFRLIPPSPSQSCRSNSTPWQAHFEESWEKLHNKFWIVVWIFY